MKLKWDTRLALICIASLVYLVGFGGIVKMDEGGLQGFVSQIIFVAGFLAFGILLFYRVFTGFR